jgi:hypothetical protein
MCPSQEVFEEGIAMTVRMVIELPRRQGAQAVVRALDTYKTRLRSSIERTQRRLNHFEQRYGVSTTQFLNTMVSEDLVGGDLEYVEWAGEARLLDGLQAELKDLEDAQYRLP